MRKYRGKRIDTGEWAEGWYCQIELLCKSYILLEDAQIADEGPRGIEVAGFVEVDPESVGESTGILDKNDKEIYEKAKVSGYIYDVSSEKLTGILQPNENPLACWMFKYNKGLFPASDLQHIEIVNDENLLESK